MFPPTFGMEATVREVRNLCAAFYLFQRPVTLDEEGDATPFRAFLPDPDLPSKPGFAATYPRLEVREDHEELLDGVSPAGIGQVLLRYHIRVYLNAYDHQNALQPEVFCRKAVRNLLALFTKSYNGNPAGIWWNSLVGAPEYLLVKVTPEYWGPVASVPLIIEKVFDKDFIRSC